MTVFKTTFSLLLCIFLLVTCNHKIQKIPPQAVKGILDLREWNFTSNGVINLDGEWEFTFGELLEPRYAYLRNLQGEARYIPVPSQWQNHGYPADGYATYRLRVILPEFVPSKSVSVGDAYMNHLQKRHGLSIAMTDTGTAYALYINGKLASVNGKVGKSKEESEPFMQHSVFSIDEFLDRVPIDSSQGTNSLGDLTQTKSTTIEILFQVSNFHYFKSGLWDTIKIGSSSDIQNKAKHTFVLDLIVFSSLLIMGIYHFVLYINRKKDKSPLYFGLFCILISLRTISINERILSDALPFIPFFIIHKLEYFSFYYGALVFLQFIQFLFPDEFSNKWRYGFSMILLPCSFLVFFFPMDIYTRVLVIVQITALIMIIYIIKALISAILHKKLGSKLVLSGNIVFSLALINDMLKSNGLLFTPNMGSYGLLTFVVFQAAVLSRRFANAFTETEKLSEELKVFSEGLEKKVKERTKSLEQAKSKIETLNEISKTVNSNLNIDAIMNLLIDYLLLNYKINTCAVYSVNAQERSIEIYCLNIPDQFPDSIKKTAKLIKFSLDDSSNVHGYVYKTRTALYTKTLRPPENKYEETIINSLKLKSSLVIPLFLDNEVIGFWDLSRTDEELILHEEDIKSLVVLSNQITGAINNSKLLEETKAAKELAEIEKGIALIAQREAELERGKAEVERIKSDKLLLNILPEEVADELKEKGLVTPVLFECTTIMFTDFKGFTQIAETMTPPELIKELDACFTQFDKITERYNLEKLKTIGDSYMCAGGIPKINCSHAIDSCLAALEIQSFMNQMKELKQTLNIPYWELRLGIHSGSVMAGVVGEKKFAYDIWGDTVNTASRMESSGTPGRINISYVTYELVKEIFDCEYRGEVDAKNKGKVKMYYLNRIKPEFAKDTDGHVPNEKFWAIYK